MDNPLKNRFRWIKSGAALAVVSVLAGAAAFATPTTVTLYKTADSDAVSGLGYGGEFVAVTSNYSTSSASTTLANLEALGYSSNAITTANATYGNTETGFDTFCLENTVSFSTATTYNYAEAGSLTGSTPDSSLTKGVAWLYDEFATGKLSGYIYTAGSSRVTDAAGLQALIWYLEGEVAYKGNGANTGSFYTSSTISTDPFYADLIGQFGNVSSAEVADTLGGYGVEVMNLSNSSGTVYQNQIILTGSTTKTGGGNPVPDAGMTLGFLGAATTGLAFIRRKLKLAI
jgi:hypothetical protein